MADSSKAKEEFRTLWGARILWPSDMPDDVMESAVSAALNQLDPSYCQVKLSEGGSKADGGASGANTNNNMANMRHGSKTQPNAAASSKLSAAAAAISKPSKDQSLAAAGGDNCLLLHPDKDGALICENLKREFDEKWGSSWVVVMGKNFGCHCVHEQAKFIYFYIGQYAFMFYKVPA